ncbi:cytochrome c [uncultured Maritimibacter sp.]|uniref:c-type cytochrome n=1 Tax=uncultured Maritimibacter sp. TaxID=991866 RepID=UPI000A71E778|nr:cytochrome c [uncultured Maritimibacter sp.]
MRNLIIAVASAVALVAAILTVSLYRGGDPEMSVDASGNAMTELVAVTVPPLDGAAAEGRIAYVKYCAGCHGPNGGGLDGLAPPLIHKIYEPSHHGDQAFYLAALQGVRAHHWGFGDMPPVEGVSEAEIGRIVTFVRTLQVANGIK